MHVRGHSVPLKVACRSLNSQHMFTSSVTPEKVLTQSSSPHLNPRLRPQLSLSETPTDGDSFIKEEITGVLGMR